MDLLRTSEVPLQPTFSYFVESVDCPAITAYDSRKWKQMKRYMVDMAIKFPVVRSAIVALSVLHRGIRYGLALSRELSFYEASTKEYRDLVQNNSEKFDAILVATFLMCLFDFVHQEAVPLLEDPPDALVNLFCTRTDDGSALSKQSTWIIIWLRILHTNALRDGGNGLISDKLYTLSPFFKTGHSITAQFRNTDANESIYDMLQMPIFDFYFQLQMISGQIAKLTHYHRSRITGHDQAEVVERMLRVRSRLVALWEARSAIQRQSPSQLRSTLAADIAGPIIRVVGLCAAAYHAEFVEMDRVLGDPVSRSTGARNALREIRDIVDGDWNCYDGDRLNAAYLRPVFLYAIECMDERENDWAAKRMACIQDRVCRSDFFAEFGVRLSDAQRKKQRRVTSKYFCIWYFGGPPPFM